MLNVLMFPLQYSDKKKATEVALCKTQIKLRFVVVESIVTGITHSNKCQTTKEANTHTWIKYHTDTGNETEHEAKDWNNWEEWCGKA